MQKTYLSFAELAEEFKCHDVSDQNCQEWLWRKGVEEFAEFLDGLGIEVNGSFGGKWITI